MEMMKKMDWEGLMKKTVNFLVSINKFNPNTVSE